MFNQSISVASHQCVASFCIPNMDLNLKKSSSSESSKSLEKYDDKLSSSLSTISTSTTNKD
ncbi:hypothetical protein DERP_004167 [Dermatophagoides pteronyssinus]|uniref:Uncharacterized protein n=1 Tax=Dermatophagoides pteronyssinus TaxID=6956 RepID=A0ABQ8J905_DERPT|nr:hypothetical protein DERP_004167 [Dermatophagoides pteronyssinus]